MREFERQNGQEDMEMIKRSEIRELLARGELTDEKAEEVARLGKSRSSVQFAHRALGVRAVCAGGRVKLRQPGGAAI